LSADALTRGEELVTHGDPARKIPACSACHGSQLTGVQPDIPGLVGLPYDYISSQLGSWRTKTRATVAPDCMSEIANRLSESDISAVSAWLANRELPADMHAQPAGSVTPPLHCGVLGDKGDGA
jgi:cytochrome c553